MSARKRRERRNWPIHGYVGANGSGKSAAMVYDSIPSLRAGRPLLSTVRILDGDNPRPCGGCEVCTVDGVRVLDHQAAHPLWIPFTDWSQLLDARSCDVLMDEVTGVASSRESHAMPAPVANALVQMRRADVTVRWSAPNWARADKIIRETSQAVTYAVGYFPKRARDSESDRVWRNRRLFRWRTYDAAQFEDFTVGKREALRPFIQELHWGPSSGVFDWYDTFDAVLSIGTVTEGGTCYRCGGRRARPACSCGKVDLEGKPAGGPAERGTPGAPRGRRARTHTDPPMVDAPVPVPPRRVRT